MKKDYAPKNFKHPDFGYVGTPFEPKRIWIKDFSSFSRKPSILKALIWIILIVGVLILFGRLTLRAVDLGNYNLCNSWQKNAEQLKAKGYVVGYSLDEIQLCNSVNIRLQ
jgi:hypothetical protein